MHQWLINWRTPRHDYPRPSDQLRLIVFRLRWLIPIYQCYRRLQQRRLIWLTKRPPHHPAISKQVIISYRQLRILSSLWWDRIQAIQHLLPINWPRRNSRSVRFHPLSNSNSKRNNRPVKELHRLHGISRSLPAAVESICQVQRVYNNLTPTPLILIKLLLALILRRAFSNHLGRRHNPFGIKIWSYSY